MAADPSLDDDLAAWFDPDSPPAKLGVLGPVTLSTTEPPPQRPAYYAELAAYLRIPGPRRHHRAVHAAFSLSPGSAAPTCRTLRELLGTDPVTGLTYMPSAKTSRPPRPAESGIYQIDGVLLDADLFRRLGCVGKPAARPEASRLRHRVTAGHRPDRSPRCVTTAGPGSRGRPDRPPPHSAVVDVAHLLATSALAAGDTATARAAADIARLAAPDEEAHRLDAAAVDCRRRTHRRGLAGPSPEQVCNRSDDGDPPMDLNPRTRQILARHRDWLSRAS